MERHDEQKLDLLFPQLAFDSADQGPSNSLPMMVRVDTEPIYFRADGAVPFDQQQTTRSSINARNPSFQDFRLLGVMPVGFALCEPFRQAACQPFENPA